MSTIHLRRWWGGASRTAWMGRSSRSSTGSPSLTHSNGTTATATTATTTTTTTNSSPCRLLSVVVAPHRNFRTWDYLAVPVPVVSTSLFSSSSSSTTPRLVSPWSSLLSMESVSSVTNNRPPQQQPQRQQQRRLLSSNTTSGTDTTASTSTATSTAEDPAFVNQETTSTNDSTETSTEQPEQEGLDEDDVANDEEPVVEDAAIAAARKQSQQLRELKDALLRSLAEQENTRAIAKRDVEQARQFAIKSFAKSLLDVADNLQRALDAVPADYRPTTTDATGTTTTTAPLTINPDIFQTLYEGIEMTEKGLKKALESHGVVQYGAVGDAFDPNQHEALMEYQDDTKIHQTIGIVMKCGYTLHRRVLRPAEVGVIKSTLTTAPNAASGSSSSSSETTTSPTTE